MIGLNKVVEFYNSNNEIVLVRRHKGKNLKEIDRNIKSMLSRAKNNKNKYSILDLAYFNILV